MNTYMDENYLAVSNTILTYTGTSENVDVPWKLGDMCIQRIGNGAFSELNNLKHLALPYGIERIEDHAFRYNTHLKSIRIPGSVNFFGEGSFCNCPSLCDIEIYDIPTDPTTYKKLKKECTLSGDGIFISANIPEFLGGKGFSTWEKPPHSLPCEEGSILFRHRKADEGTKRHELFGECDCIRFCDRSDIKSEDSAFLYNLETDNFVKLSYDTECLNDAPLNPREPLCREKTVLFTFDDSLTKKHKDAIYITATIKLGYYFLQTVKRVICNRADYYVYRRAYLSSKKNIGFVREDAAIYKDGKLVTDIEEAQCVYGKYKLLSIL